MKDVLNQIHEAAAAKLGKELSYPPSYYLSGDFEQFSVSMANYTDRLSASTPSELLSLIDAYDPQAHIKAQIAALEAQLDA